METFDEIRDLHDLVRIVEQLMADPDVSTSQWWRGQGRDWPLLPKVYRQGQEVADTYEWQMASKFRQRALSRHESCPGTDELEAWLFLMQHYGLPTRLLDWTENPLTGIYFAVKQMHDDEPGFLWYLDPSGLAGLRASNNPVAQRHFAKAMGELSPDEEDPERVICIFPSEVDHRVMVQQSVFTVHPNAEPLEAQENAEDHLFKIEIPPESKPVLETQLRAFGMTQRHVFPDLTHLADELSGWIEDGRPKL